jgi:hypothetical protein
VFQEGKGVESFNAPSKRTVNCLNFSFFYLSVIIDYNVKNLTSAVVRILLLKDRFEITSTRNGNRGELFQVWCLHICRYFPIRLS